jgi:hypothetical protein
VGIAAKLTVEGAEELTRAPRMPMDVDGTIRGKDAHSFDIVMQDLSETGCLVETSADLEIGTVVLLRVAGFPQSAARIVRRDGFRYGCEFLAPLSRDELSATRDQETLHQSSGGGLPSVGMVALFATAIGLTAAASWPGSGRLVTAIAHWVR